MEKNARELLEESLTYISLPVALYGGVQVTSWVGGSEFEPRRYGHEWFEGMVLSNLVEQPEEVKVEIIDPEAVIQTSDGSIHVNSVCAIGAVALSSLSDSRQVHLGYGEYRDWSTQVRINPDVALATVVLAFTVAAIRTEKDPDYFGSTTTIANTAANTLDKGLDFWINRYHAVKEQASKPETYLIVANEYGADVEPLACVVTGYNDEQMSWKPVAALFEKSIKTLIEYGF